MLSSILVLMVISTSNGLTTHLNVPKEECVKVQDYYRNGKSVIPKMQASVFVDCVEVK